MSDNSSTPVMERRRKRVRKGTRSCWECKRRKIKCIYQPEDPSTCAGCLDKGTSCLSQEHVEEPPRDEGSSALGKRMGRVEMLLEKMMEKVSQPPDENRASYHPVDAPASSTPTSMYDSQPQFRSSVFDDVLGQQGEANIAMTPPEPVSVSNLDTLASARQGSSIGRLEKLRQQLAAMLPCQEDVDIFSTSSHGWWLMQRHMLPHLLRIPEEELQKPHDVSIVSRSHPMMIARLLLCVALCIQQLPPDFDPRTLQTKVPLRDMMERNMAFIITNVTSDDELTGSVEGIECFVLQGLYQVLAGNFRRGWLAFRKAVNVAQLMGFHKVSLKTSQDPPDLMETKRHYMWFQIIREERYLSLVLGVPSATGSTPIPFNDQAPWLSTEDLYHKHLCEISGLILVRNQGDSSRAFSATQEIDEKLDSLAKGMPRTWWEIPTSLIDERTDEAAAQFGRMMCHIWHFEFETIVHLPFMLRTGSDRRYEYNRISCLIASRNLIMRWMFIRSAYGRTLFSNLTEFHAFTSAITLLLGLLGSTPTDPVALKERHEDLQLVETVVQIFEGMKQFNTGLNVVSQSISVIRTLQGIIRDEGNSSRNLRLEIPHFGTISIARGGAVQSLEGERILGANPRSQATSMQAQAPLQALRSNPIPPPSATGPTWPSMTVSNNQSYQDNNDNGQVIDGNGAWLPNTAVQFTSNQFPTFEAQNMDNTTAWPFQETNMMFFDSLLNTDVAGNWDI